MRRTRQGPEEGDLFAALAPPNETPAPAALIDSPLVAETGEMNPRLTSLCYIEREGCYLILHRTKKEHDENGDKWIGVGGKFEPGESPLECALREVREETGLTMTNPRFRGLVTFVSDEWGTEYMHLFTCTEFTGTLTDCDEGELVWLAKDKLLKKKMWAGDRLFLKALDERTDFFSLKLCYRGEELVESKFE